MMFEKTNNQERTGKHDIRYFGRTNFRNSSQVFGIDTASRLAHTYIVGKTGTGKTTLLETLIRQDIDHHTGCSLIDPHGDMVESIVQSIPKHRQKDIIYINATDPNSKWGYNPIRRVSEEKRALAASGMLEIFKKLWSDAWGVRMEHIFRNILLTLYAQPKATLDDIPKIFSDQGFRNSCLRNVSNPAVRAFWLDEFAKYSPRLRADAIIPIQNKVGAFLSNPIIRRIIVDPKQEVSLRTAMDEGKIILINLAKGRIGEDASHLLGGLLITTLGLAAFTRAELPPPQRRPFIIYVDEFQNFTTLALVNMLSELRKYATAMVLANQYLDQLDIDIRDAVLGNVGTFISFRVGPKDARYIARELYPMFLIEDIINLPNYRIYLKLLINGTPSKPFSADTLRYIDLQNK